ncbi:di-heme oxidoredictase family protein [Methylotenera sp.]|uniref:di-heme oxidoredictase family protein n=1 Tax=Methylotenera sp. TaxID=2051956 RepID=UPI0025DC4B03|nr:di-heme oxidoredictase family protein [Methylotenera sp.]
MVQRTPPLWGIGLAKNLYFRARFLHNGRTSTTHSHSRDEILQITDHIIPIEHGRIESSHQTD